MLEESKARAEAPSPPELGVLYHEIAAAEERHRAVVETIATRYGHTPCRNGGGGLGETLGRLRDKVGELGIGPLQRLANDLMAKANAVHWCTAWVQTFEAIGDGQSARELAIVLDESKAHRDALQEALNRLVTRGALGEGVSTVK